MSVTTEANVPISTAMIAIAALDQEWHGREQENAVTAEDQRGRRSRFRAQHGERKRRPHVADIAVGTGQTVSVVSCKDSEPGFRQALRLTAGEANENQAEIRYGEVENIDDFKERFGGDDKVNSSAGA